MHCVRCAAAVLMSNAEECLLTEKTDEWQTAVTEILNLNLNTELILKIPLFTSLYICEYKISSQS